MALPVLGTGKFRAFTAAGAPLAGGKLWTYASGTSTPLGTYPTAADAAAGTNANADPVILDASGEASVWVNSAAYKFVLQDANGVTLETVDGYAPGNLIDPRTAFIVAKNGSTTGFASAPGVNVTSWTTTLDTLSEWDGAQWTAKYAGNYFVSCQLEVSDTGTNIALTLNVGGFGGAGSSILGTTHGTAGVHTAITLSRVYAVGVGTVLRPALLGSANTTVYPNSTFSIAKIP